MATSVERAVESSTCFSGETETNLINDADINSEDINSNSTSIDEEADDALMLDQEDDGVEGSTVCNDLEVEKENVGDLGDGLSEKVNSSINKDDEGADKSSDPVVVDESVGGTDEVKADENQQVSEKDAHLQKETELEAYLESIKDPKPKRKTIKEMLMSLPGYKNLSNMKPQIGGTDGKKEKVIDLDDERYERKKSRDVKRQQQIEALKDRFVRHCITAPPKSGKGEHVKLKIKKKEEDSQGIEHLVENEVDYIRNPLNEEEDAVSFLTPQVQQTTSPQASVAPGANRRRLQETLLEKIRARKLKEHEERVKEFKMYNDENDGDDKGEKSEDEEIEDEEESENESDVQDEEEEEELEDLLDNSSKKGKKKRSKSAFVDEEAEDDDADDDNDDDDDQSNNEDSEDSDSTEEEDEKEQNTAEKETKDLENGDDLASFEASEESIPSAQRPRDKISELSTPVKNSMNDDSQKSEGLGADFTPKVNAAVLNHDFKRTPSDFWIPSNSNTNRRSDELSPIIPRLNKASLENKTNSEPSVPTLLANVISEPQAKFDDLVDLCSGRFVTQVNTGGLESQEEDEFKGFDFGDDDMCNENNDNVDENPKTPKADTSITAVDGITPKLSEKAPKTRLLMQFNEEAEKTEEENAIKDEADPINSLGNLEEDEDEIIGIRTKGRKQKRLQFSDDEDEDEGPAEVPSNSQSEDEESAEELELEEEAEEMFQEEEITQEQPISKGLFINKHGRMKRKFVEDEAELSGSEEGSDDEDERGLNHYEKDEADDEEIDQEALKNQVERAHLKQLLDDDDREIRDLQNRYLENGDLHTDKQRERKFTWKINMDELNDDAHFGDSDDEQMEETPEDATRKQEWIEKRKWMSENSHLLDGDEDESQSLLSNSRFLKISKNTIKRLESFVDTSTSESSNVVIKETSIQRRSIYEEIIKTKSDAKKNAADITSCSEGMNVSSDTNDGDQSNKSVSQPLFGEITKSKNSAALKKGSFLTRGGMMLAKLAEGSKPGDAVSNVKNNSRNFVFQHITPPNPEKTDGSTSRVKRVSSFKAGKQAVAKKLKIDRSFSNLDEASKGASIFKWL